MMRTKDWAKTVAMASLAVAFAGCFTTRTPEDPSGGAACFEFNTFTANYVQAIENIEGALLCGDVTQYQNMIQAQFEYWPSSSVAQTYPTVFPSGIAGGDWFANAEDAFVVDLFQSAKFDANLREEEINVDDQGTTVILTSQYLITDQVSGVSYVAIGKFTFIQDTDLQWRMSKWVDEDVAGELPFGDRRGSSGGSTLSAQGVE